MSEIHGKMDVITLGDVFAVGDPPQEAEPKGYVITGISLGGVMYRPDGKPFVIEVNDKPQPVMAFEYAEQCAYEELHRERRSRHG